MQLPEDGTFWLLVTNSRHFHCTYLNDYMRRRTNQRTNHRTKKSDMRGDYWELWVKHAFAKLRRSFFFFLSQHTMGRMEDTIL